MFGANRFVVKRLFGTGSFGWVGGRLPPTWRPSFVGFDALVVATDPHEGTAGSLVARRVHVDGGIVRFWRLSDADKWTGPLASVAFGRASPTNPNERTCSPDAHEAVLPLVGLRLDRSRILPDANEGAGAPVERRRAADTNESAGPLLGRKFPAGFDFGFPLAGVDAFGVGVGAALETGDRKRKLRGRNARWRRQDQHQDESRNTHARRHVAGFTDRWCCTTTHRNKINWNQPGKGRVAPLTCHIVNRYDTIRYDTVDLRALKSWRDGQLNLAHGPETKNDEKNKNQKPSSSEETETCV